MNRRSCIECWGSGGEEEEKGNDIAFRGRDRKGVEVEGERGGLYLGRPGWGLGRLRGGREPAWRLERGGMGKLS